MMATSTEFAHKYPVATKRVLRAILKATDLCASEPVIDLIHNRARTFVYSTGLPPPIVAAAIAALDTIEQDLAYAGLPLAKAKRFTELAGLQEARSPIVPLILGEAETALAAAQLLEAEGFLVVAIRPPTVPPGTARLRFTFSAGHPDGEIERLGQIVRTLVPAPTHREAAAASSGPP